MFPRPMCEGNSCKDFLSRCIPFLKAVIRFRIGAISISKRDRGSTNYIKKVELKFNSLVSIDETIYQNSILGNMAEDNFELASKICQNMIDQGQFPRDNQGEEIELEGTLTLEFE